jgi:hypothetical protein
MAKNGAPWGTAALRRKPTTPGHSRAATSASSGACVSNWAQLATLQSLPQLRDPIEPLACGSAASGQAGRPPIHSPAEPSADSIEPWPHLGTAYQAADTQNAE